MRVLIAGGGTGGHVIPALAIARELKARHNAEVLFVGTARGMENRLVPQAGFGLMRVKVVFENPEGKIRPGVAGRMLLQEKKNA